MHVTRIFAVAATLCTLAACSNSPTLSTPAARGRHDIGGMLGSGNNMGTAPAPAFASGLAESPTTMGSGNINSNTTATSTCTSENGGLLGTGNETGTGTCDNGPWMGSGN